MRNVYKEVSSLDERAISEFYLSDELLMENAANVMQNVVSKYASVNSMIIIVAGSGNNGADGLALARMLSGKYNIKVFMPKEAKSELAKLQKKRFEAVGGKFIDKLFLCDIVVDCLFGSGFRGELDSTFKELINQMNKIARLKIACDMPSGVLDSSCDVAFKANITISMGGLKLDYFSDYAKDFMGEIVVANLGVSKDKYEIDSNIKLLEKSDLALPSRIYKNTHKGNFGHTCIIAGEKEGASILSALSAFAFGSGLVSVIGEVKNLPPHIMNTKSLPKNCNAIAFGMGLGDRIYKYDFEFLGDIPCVLDADMFYNKSLESMIKKGNIILTPHLKEFSSMLKILGFGDYDIKYIAKHKFDLLQNFIAKYPNVVLLLKGANIFIAYDNKIYINTLGSNALAKGGSGDVLSGVIASLLSQGYSLLNAAISGSLAHSIASNNIKGSYSLEPLDLINSLKSLEFNL